MRLAIGASRGRLVRQLLAESLLLSAIGAAGGVFVARWLSATLVGFLRTESNQVFLDLTTDWRVFAFTGLGQSLVTIVIIHTIFGLPTMTLLFRNYFFSLPHELFKAARVDENTLELNEGLAEYTGTRLSGLAESEQRRHVARHFETYPTMFPTYVRSFAYLT